ncbi:hypothetical protein [Aquitalea pelogenes]|uniref:hypothetical protein n=1 Tax=Aquitalea pelogenes TaxID=1293573 RepID=UPI00128FA7F4|nr:hypothetical protein [Aquitalea pelogenes]
MIDWITGAYSGLTAAKDITKALIEIKEAAAVSGKALELNAVILDVQDKLFNARNEREDLQRQIKELESKLASVESWEETKSRYQLVSIHDGCHVYIENGQEPDLHSPPPYYCPTCFLNRNLVILQSPIRTMNRRTYKCAVCGTETLETRA